MIKLATAYLNSFVFALHGISVMARTQRNARTHVLAVCIVVAAGLYFGLSRLEWAGIVVAMLLVLICEAINTAIEFLADAVLQEHHPLIKQAKDVAAGAVLIAALGAVILGLLILGPHTINFLLQSSGNGS